MKEYQKAIIELLIEKELLTAEVYKSFARRFPRHEAFWLRLSTEETEHAAWVQHLLDLSTSRDINYDEGKTRTYTIKTFNDYLRGLRAEALSPGLRAEKALALTVDIEKSLLERHLFAQFKSSSDQTQRILAVLQKGLEDHLTYVEDYVARVRKSV
jgi:rubrerythrin